MNELVNFENQMEQTTRLQETLAQWREMNADKPPPEFAARDYMEAEEAARFEQIWRDHVARCKAWLTVSAG